MTETTMVVWTCVEDASPSISSPEARCEVQTNWEEETPRWSIYV